MSHTNCPHETAVAKAARSGQWTEELLIHREDCLACAELALVVAALAGEAEALISDPRPLPEPEAIWLRASLEARRRKFRRATRPILWMQMLAIIVAGGIGLSFAPGLWKLLRLAASGTDWLGGLPQAAGSPLLVLITSALVIGGLFVWELTMPQEG